MSKWCQRVKLQPDGQSKKGLGQYNVEKGVVTFQIYVVFYIIIYGI